MEKKLVVAVITLVTLLSPASTVFLLAQDRLVAADWSAVQALSSGDEVVVEKKDGATVKGKVQAVSNDNLVVARGNSRIDLEANGIKKVYRLSGRSRGKSAAIGAAIGGGAGTGAGIAVFAQGDFVGGVVPLFAVIGAGIGAAIGAAFGGKRKRVLIYEAR